jgi:hypothetical protein
VKVRWLIERSQSVKIWSNRIFLSRNKVIPTFLNIGAVARAEYPTCALFVGICAFDGPHPVTFDEQKHFVISICGGAFDVLRHFASLSNPMRELLRRRSYRCGIPIR